MDAQTSLMLWASGAFAGWCLRSIRCTATEGDASSSEVCFGEYADTQRWKWKVYVKLRVSEGARVVREDGRESAGVIREQGQLEVTFPSGRTHKADLAMSGCISWSNGTRWARVG